MVVWFSGGLVIVSVHFLELGLNSVLFPLGYLVDRLGSKVALLSSGTFPFTEITQTYFCLVIKDVMLDLGKGGLNVLIGEKSLKFFLAGKHYEVWDQANSCATICWGC